MNYALIGLLGIESAKNQHLNNNTWNFSTNKNWTWINKHVDIGANGCSFLETWGL